MAAIPVVLNGATGDGQPITIVGTLAYADRGVGGGPLPGGEHPAHPIAPGGRPPGTWGGAGEGFPTPPIHLPPVGPPTEPPPDGESKPPPESGGWGYWGDPVNAWVYKPGEGEASPKA